MPGDSHTDYFGQPFTPTVTTTAGAKRIYAPRAGTITRCVIQVHNQGGTQGTSETSTMSFRLNNTTDTTLSSTIVANAASGASTVQSVTGLAIAMAADDYFEIKWVTPAWATNPTNVVTSVQLYME